MVAAAHFLLAADPVPRLRGIAETRSGERIEGWLRFEGETLVVEEIAGGRREVGASELKVAHMHLVAAAAKNQPQVPARTAGLVGSYFPKPNFAGEPVKRVDASVDFNWQGGSPLPQVAGFPNEQFSVRWEGEIETAVAGEYRFHSRTDDGARLWIGGQQVIDRWQDQAESEHSGAVRLEGGRRYPLRFEFYDNSSTAVAKLLWTPPGGKREIIPTARLTHATDPAASDRAFAARIAAGAGGQHGLLGTYFKGTDFEGRVAERVDRSIQFDWKGGSPIAGLNGEHFSIRWEGEVVAPLTGKVTFHTRTNDGLRLLGRRAEADRSLDRDGGHRAPRGF